MGNFNVNPLYPAGCSLGRGLGDHVTKVGKIIMEWEHLLFMLISHLKSTGLTYWIQYINAVMLVVSLLWSLECRRWPMCCPMWDICLSIESAVLQYSIQCLMCLHVGLCLLCKLLTAFCYNSSFLGLLNLYQACAAVFPKGVTSSWYRHWGLLCPAVIKDGTSFVLPESNGCFFLAGLTLNVEFTT